MFILDKYDSILSWETNVFTCGGWENVILYQSYIKFMVILINSLSGRNWRRYVFRIIYSQLKDEESK